ncbi:MAG: LysM peptidoglycan-binding domain-containing protein [Anaerolineae bacterium]
MHELFYTVKPGDSLSKIAEELWGNAMRWPELFEANRDQLQDPNMIRVGQKLHIPGSSVEFTPSAPAADTTGAEAPAAKDAGDHEQHGKGKQVRAE